MKVKDKKVINIRIVIINNIINNIKNKNKQKYKYKNKNN